MKKFLIFNALFLFFIIESSYSYWGINDTCDILFNVGEWKGVKIKRGDRYWSRYESWYGSDGWISENGSVIELEDKYNTHHLLKNPKTANKIIYIGKWQKTLLPYPNTKKKQQKEIRLVATQHDGTIRSHYEIKNELNKDIKPQELDLITIPPVNKMAYCEILWDNKFGHDAIADYKLNIWRFFTGKTMSGSGKIINYKTGKVIADKDGNLIKK